MSQTITQPLDVARRAQQDTVNSIRNGVILIFLAFGCFGGWAAFAPLHGAVITSGQVKVESSRKTIQHLEGGIVDQILVKEGGDVKIGQSLIVLQNSRVSAEVAILQDQTDSTLAQMARLQSEKKLANRITFPESLIARAKESKVQEIIDNETRLFNTQRSILFNQIRLIKNQISQIKSETYALQNQIAASGKTMQYLNDELKVNEGLAAKGFVASPKLLEFKRAISQQESSISEYSADMERARQRESELRLRIASLQDDYIKKAAGDLAQAQEKQFDLQERMRVPADQLSRQTVTSPVDGRVVGLKVHTVGGVVSAGEPIMDIVPSNPNLLVEIRVKPQDIEEVHQEMKAEVMLTAFKQRITPLVTGKVTYVSADSLVDEATKQSYYSAHVQVDADALKKYSKDVSLYPGMPTEVYLLTKQRTALDYLLEPLLSTVRRSMRES